ncbi:dynamin family protein [Umezawaea sp. NPDC059074]|uniref:dynamin family protein n=1 Tax=Umezawaea sp. NPDC059074 TaxID=3346716 RepID=UPI0036B0A516
MTDPDLVEHLRADVRELLREVSDTFAGTEHAHLRDAVQADIAALGKAELVIPVVAPTNAGKSTILNAVVGAEVLPSRAGAMTTVPTRIVLDPAIATTALHLDSSDVAELERITGLVAVGDGDAVTRYPHLSDLFERIRAATLEPWRAEYRGIEIVRSALTRINDVVRLGELVDAGTVTGRRLIPSVHVPYASGNTAGRVVLVDTPGTDEFGLATLLGEVVVRQLEQAHLVVVVLDYTSMNRTADADLHALVEPIVGNMGAHKLFGVVNKVDERRSPQDMDAEQVDAFARNHLGITAEGRVVETTARRALLASRFLRRVEEGPVDLSTDQTVRDLAVELYPVDHELQLTLLTAEHLVLTAQRMWADSGIPRMLELVVDTARTTLLTTLMDGALNRADGWLAAYGEQVRISTAEALAAAEVLDEQLGPIEADMTAIVSVYEVGKTENKRRTKRDAARAAAANQAIEALQSRSQALIDGVRGNEKGFKSKRKAREFVAETIELPRRRLQQILDENQALLLDIAHSALSTVHEDGPAEDLVARAAAHLDVAIPIPPTAAGLPTISRVDLGHIKIKWAWDEYQKEKVDEYGFTETVTRYKSDLSEARAGLRLALTEAVGQLTREMEVTYAAIRERIDAYQTSVNKVVIDYAEVLTAEHGRLQAQAEDKRARLVNGGREVEQRVTDLRTRLSGYLEHLSAR